MKPVIILDFDGTIISSSRVEKICRKILRWMGVRHPPRILFAISETIDFFHFILFKKMKKIIVNKHLIKMIDDNRFVVGILTDRSRCSLCLYLRSLGIDKEKLFFIQARKSVFDLYPCRIRGKIKTSPKIKPHRRVYDELILFIYDLGVKIKDVWVIDDLDTARETASRIGFLTAHPDNHQAFPS